MHGKEISQLDKSTYTKLVLSAESTLYRVAKTILMNDKDCEDAVQEAILKSYEKRNTLREEKFFQTWLVRILINECYAIQRKARPAVPYEEYMDGMDEKAAEIETEAADYSELYQALYELPEAIRITVVLYYVEGYALKEIKKILDIPEGTVKSRLSKGRKLLKSKLESKR